MDRSFTVEVCLALAEGATIIEVEVASGATVQDVVEKSGLRERHPELSLAECGLGSFGRLLKPADVVKQGDRIEIYRPLLVDPKEMRRRAAGRKPTPSE